MDVIFPSSRCVARCSGFSLPELMIAVTLSSILLSMAIPAFSTLIDDTGLSSQVNEFAGYLNYARSEAIKTGKRVEICKSADGASCNSGSDWQDGWIVFVDADTNRLRNGDEPLLQSGVATAKTLAIDYSAFPTDNYVVYYPDGMSLGNGTFIFCDERGATQAHALILYKTGRLRSADTMPDGTPITCPL
jgi:type IV fimbrial biogenesis protein FimT